MKMIRVIALTAAVMFCFASVSGAAAMKIGFVDLQKALITSAAGQAAKAKMDVEVKKVEKEVKKRQQELSSAQQALQKQLALLSDTAKQEKELAFQQKVKDYKRFAKDKQDQLKSKEMMLTQQIIKDLRVQVQQLCKDKGLSMIFEKGQLVYAVDAVDYTDALIKSYNASYNKNHKKK